MTGDFPSKLPSHLDGRLSCFITVWPAGSSPNTQLASSSAPSQCPALLRFSFVTFLCLVLFYSSQHASQPLPLCTPLARYFPPRLWRSISAFSVVSRPAPSLHLANTLPPSRVIPIFGSLSFFLSQPLSRPASNQSGSKNSVVRLPFRASQQYPFFSCMIRLFIAAPLCHCFICIIFAVQKLNHFGVGIFALIFAPLSSFHFHRFPLILPGGPES